MQIYNKHVVQVAAELSWIFVEFYISRPMSEQLIEYELNKAFYSPSIYYENLLEGVAHSYKKQIENHAIYC